MIRDTVLEVKNLSKYFQIHENSTDNFKEAILRIFNGGKNLSRSFCALKNVSFELHEGDALGIIGKNGAGKSTLLRILSGISQPDEGEINFYGKAVSILDIGAGFHQELTGRENIFLSASLYKFTHNDIKNRFREIVDFSGLEKFIDEPVKNYSSGMYLRLAFSIITCLEADIYLIDEVINVGDVDFQMKCKNRIDELMLKGKTLLVASHNMNEIASLCNRILLLERGEIIESGDSDVIQKYMTIALPEQFVFEEDNFFHVKSVADMRLSNSCVKIIDYKVENYKTTLHGISTKDSFEIIIDIELTEAVNIVVRLGFYDATGVLVFVCISIQNNVAPIQTPGIYRVIFLIPSNLLNERFYSVDLTFVNIDSRSQIYKVDKFLTIKMACDTNDPHSVPQPGIVRPFIKVSILNH